MIITIDGPMASGKSTLALLLTQRLTVQGKLFYYLNTGLLYRALAYVLMKKYAYTVEHMGNPLLEQVSVILSLLQYVYDVQGAHLYYENEDITSYLKNEITDQAASIISAVPIVREALLDWQRLFARNHNLIADGRDCGTVVFPHADKKFFVTASVKERARRWQLDESRRGNIHTLAESIAQLVTRDQRDETRSIAPLRIPENALIIDTTHLTIEQAVDQIMLKI